MPFASEAEMYPPVCVWLERLLREKHPASTVQVYDASRKSLARLLKQTGLTANVPLEWPSWDIHVDIVGLAIDAKITELAFVECKTTPITLRHLSQLLGYSRVALPQYAFIVSPQGPSDALKSLLVTYRRTDVLAYDQREGKFSGSLIVARWDKEAATLDYGSLIAADVNFQGRL